jgi:copper homeostasis protein CutC
MPTPESLARQQIDQLLDLAEERWRIMAAAGVDASVRW